MSLLDISNIEAGGGGSDAEQFEPDGVRAVRSAAGAQGHVDAATRRGTGQVHRRQQVLPQHLLQVPQTQPGSRYGALQQAQGPVAPVGLPIRAQS